MRFLALGLMCLLLLGCAHHKGQTESAGSRGDYSDFGLTAAQRDAPTCSIDDSCGTDQLCIHSVCTDIRGSMAECTAARVYFDKDSSDLDLNGRQLQLRISRCMKADHRIDLTIAGNTNGSGTLEHNRDLDDRRASGVGGSARVAGVSRAHLTDHQIKILAR